MTGGQEKVYSEMENYFKKKYPSGKVPWYNFYDILEVWEEDLPAGQFKEVADKLAGKWCPEVKGHIYRNI